MGGQKQHALSPGPSVQVVLQSLVLDQILNVGRVEFRKVAEFHQKAAEVVEYAVNDPDALGLGQVRQRHAQVVERDVALAGGDPVSGRGKHASGGISDPARQNPEKPEQESC